MRSPAITSRWLGLGFCLFAALPLFGCGGKPGRAQVSGKVTVAGKGPLTGGSITFVLLSDEKETGGGVIKSDGTYEAVDVPVGECKVLIGNSHLNPSKSGMGGPSMGMGGPGMGMGKGMGGPPSGVSGPKPGDKDKMGAAPKGADVDPKMGEGKDTGSSKYIKIDTAYEAAGTTTLRHTVTKGENPNANFDVK